MTPPARASLSATVRLVRGDVAARKVLERHVVQRTAMGATAITSSMRFLTLPPGSFRGYPSIRDPDRRPWTAEQSETTSKPVGWSSTDEPGSIGSPTRRIQTTMDPAGGYRRFATAASVSHSQDYDAYAMHGSHVSATYNDLYSSTEDEEDYVGIDETVVEEDIAGTKAFHTPMEDRDMNEVGELNDITHNLTMLAMDDCGIVEGEDYYSVNDARSDDKDDSLTEYDRIMGNRFSDIDVSVSR